MGMWFMHVRESHKSLNSQAVRLINKTEHSTTTILQRLYALFLTLGYFWKYFHLVNKLQQLCTCNTTKQQSLITTKLQYK